jgi:hypothetical protein
MTTPVGDAMAPHDLFDTERWRLVLPVAEEGQTEPAGVAAPWLHVWSHPLYFFGDSLGWMHHVAPVAGAGPVTRCELRQRVRDGDAAWPLGEDQDHILAMTAAVDLSSIDGDRRAVIARIGDDGPADPLAIVADMRDEPGRVVVAHPGGETTALDGVDRTPFSLRITVTGQGAARRCYVFAGPGEASPPAVASWPVAEFAPVGGCYFTAGVCNVEPNTGTGIGKAIMRHKRLTVV